MNQAINKAIVIVAALGTCMLSSVFANPQASNDAIARARIIQITGTPHQDMRVKGTYALQWLAPSDTGGAYTNLFRLRHLSIKTNGQFGRTRMPLLLKLKLNNKEFTSENTRGIPVTDKIMKEAKSLTKENGKSPRIDLKLHLYEDEQGAYKFYHAHTDGGTGMREDKFIGSFDILLADNQPETTDKPSESEAPAEEPAGGSPHSRAPGIENNFKIFKEEVMSEIADIKKMINHLMEKMNK